VKPRKRKSKVVPINVDCRISIDELGAGRRQIEETISRREAAKIIATESATKASAYWNDASGYILNENGLRNLAKVIRKHGLDETLSAIDDAINTYLKFDPDNRATDESAEKAFRRIGPICDCNRMAREQGKPYLPELFRFRGLLAKRIGNYGCYVECLQWMEIAIAWGVTTEQLKSIAFNATSWRNTWDRIDTAIEATPQWKQHRQNAPQAAGSVQ
jgi:hypothetical protein